MNFDSIGAAISLCPTSGEEIARYPFQTPNQLDAALTRVQKSFEKWSVVDIDVRVTFLLNLATELRKQAKSMAIMAANEMGKPIAQGRAEIEKMCSAL